MFVTDLNHVGITECIKVTVCDPQILLNAPKLDAANRLLGYEVDAANGLAMHVDRTALGNHVAQDAESAGAPKSQNRSIERASRSPHGDVRRPVEGTINNRFAGREFDSECAHRFRSRPSFL